MNIGKVKLALAGLSLAMLLPSQMAYAGFASGSAVTMGGDPIFRIASGAEGYTAEHRAWLAQDALDNALVLSRDKSPSAVTVDRVNGAWVVMLGGRVVATADSGSAEVESLSAEALANRWADSIKNFLADDSKTDNYVANLTGKNPVQATVAVVERRLYAPAGLAFPVHLTRDIIASNLAPGEVIEARLDKDVPLGHYVIPANSTVIGEVVQNNTNDYVIRFTTLRTPSGTEVPISAYASADYVVSSSAPHRVCTYVIPSGSANGMPGVVGRVPASIGIGAVSGSRTTTLVLNKNTDLVASEPMILVFESSTPVAVITRDTAM
ncbi:MAG: hypothetical protein K2W82_09710 [Candidatus Obscuribacterales bacterium]|nr:hypothetical protein [Candidatus Obscuribacterales bacterium]